MNAGIAHRRCSPTRGEPDGGKTQLASPAFARWGCASRSSGRARNALLLGFTIALALRVGEAHAQDAGMLDERVTQQSINETICRPGYADTVAPPFDELMAHKDRLLVERGIGADSGAAFAIDRRVPIVLGGSPNAPANLDLLPWAGKQGERRKARAAVMLKRCVCEGKMSLAEAQAAIIGNWSVVYAGFSQTSCDVSRLDVATGESGGRGVARDGAP
ncbi:hypothetical protein LFL96_21785 [Paraburkholderia sp. D15]|uniref:hypothetical protein n=1 Tax=Paraburkholderia sp. D15 TaxID=2880218 RepID=UPI00247A1D06|nr:hypothetical protein [Paraburkholderia sp. D15]WGS53680.1 hypothetical protein LFL96_21785 [Paraburkholderia sp. D15]WKF60936.1 hypothetical protein HUO10_005458 [Paraburkholderia busanensis]